MELVGQPGSAVAVEIPADGVGPVLVQGVEGIHGVALGLGHLVAVSVQDQAQDDDVLIGGLVEEQGGFRMQGIEPSSCLVHGFGDELCREPALEQLLVLKWIVVLGERHGAGVEPAVDDFGHALHGAAAVGAGDQHVVHERSVELDLCVFGVAGEPSQLFFAAHGDLLSAVRTFPDVQRSAPVTVPGDAPVLDVLQPVAESSLADGGRDPVDLLVVADQVVLDRRHLDEPGLSRIVEKGRAASPAVGIVVLESGSVEKEASSVQVL